MGNEFSDQGIHTLDWNSVNNNNICSGERYGVYYFLDNAAQLDWRQDYDLLYANSGIAAQGKVQIILMLLNTLQHQAYVSIVWRALPIL